MSSISSIRRNRTTITNPFYSGSITPNNLNRRALSIIHEESSSAALGLDHEISNLLSPHPHPAFRNESYGNPNEILSGPLVLLSSVNRPQRILMSIVRTTVDHFALVYRYNNHNPLSRSKSSKSLTNEQSPVCCINLRGVIVERAECSFGTGIVGGFTLRPKNPDYFPATTSVLMFLCPEPDDRDYEENESILCKWITALSSSSNANYKSGSSSRTEQQRKSSMPMVEEEDEEDLMTSEDEEESEEDG